MIELNILVEKLSIQKKKNIITKSTASIVYSAESKIKAFLFMETKL